MLVVETQPQPVGAVAKAWAEAASARRARDAKKSFMATRGRDDVQYNTTIFTIFVLRHNERSSGQNLIFGGLVIHLLSITERATL